MTRIKQIFADISTGCIIRVDPLSIPGPKLMHRTVNLAEEGYAWTKILRFAEAKEP